MNMNLDHLEFQISELHDHVGTLLNEIREGKMKEDCEGGLEVDLGHLLDHICWAWNLKECSIEQSSSLSDEEFLRASNSIPNFGLERTLLKGTHYETKLPNKSQ
ncbi:hypothetical protein QEH52_19545 [Coraliomargarita sp. SDUM461003]|uniref:DinB-like domain-containing protein n=1 Tax=Thalassobacterium maritimum TaxID=3041265 RepID=A0ABU1B2Q7_9BACT|nr:hypothetical protein [Coraliomargarita sp. SDUM461003]MDQ8209722.1 hypothetical protein [Coraliomargarita sp. SDUM461003]